MYKITLCLLSLALGSCVTQAKYDEALATGQMYQREAHDNAEYIAQLEAERGQWEQGMSQMDVVDVVDAAYTEDIDARLASLRSMLSGIGHDVDEVSMFEVEGGYGYSMANSVVFSSGSAALSGEGRELIGAMAKEIAAKPYQRVWIRGHTDGDPVKKPATLKLYPYGNIQLSSARALEVAMALKAGGLPLSKLAVAGLGSSQPVASNKTAAGKAQNRRVEIFVIDQAQAAGQ
jgi:flagellar motor protein MotB